MVYLHLCVETPRGKLREIWDHYQKHVMKIDRETVEKVGGKYIGYFYTEYGNMNEINFLVAYPNLEARQKMLELYHAYEDEEFQKQLAKWYDYSPKVTVKVMRPLAESALQ